MGGGGWGGGEGSGAAEGPDRIHSKAGVLVKVAISLLSPGCRSSQPAWQQPYQRSHAGDSQPIPCPSPAPHTSSATPPLPPPLQPIRRLIATDFANIRMLETQSLHKGIQGSKHRFMTLPPGRDKMDLLDEVRSKGRSVGGVGTWGSGMGRMKLLPAGQGQDGLAGQGLGAAA